MVEPQPAPLPSRDQQHADFAGAQSFLAAAPRGLRRGAPRGGAARLAIGKPHRRRRLGLRASAAQSG